MRSAVAMAVVFLLAASAGSNARCAPGRAKRRRVVRGRRRRGRVAAVAKGRETRSQRRQHAKRIRHAVKPYMVRPAMQEEIAVWLKEKLRSYIRHRGEVPSTALVP